MSFPNPTRPGRDDAAGSGNIFHDIQVSGGRVQIGHAYYIGADDCLNRLPYAADAPFNSFSEQHEPGCLQDTRTDLLHEIHSWVDGQDERCIFWLEGLAGTGKSTISRTVARRFFDKNRLAASFFFRRGGGDVSRADRFVSSIAVQMAGTIPALRRHISDAFAERPDIVGQSLRDQWQRLVLRPFARLDGGDGRWSYVLIVDALDECDNDNDVRIIVQLLAEARLSAQGRLRVLLSSRAETPIRSFFHQMPARGYRHFVLHNIPPSIVDQDICKFYWHRLTITCQEKYLGPGWPGKEVVGNLMRRASGLFIWAATACRFIHEGRLAEKRLSMLLENAFFNDPKNTSPERHLDLLYLAVLQNSIRLDDMEEEKKEFYKQLREILGSVVALSSDLSVESLCKFLGVSNSTMYQTLSDLHAILDIPSDLARPLRLHHPSFRDFLLNQKRCTDPNFSVDETLVHAVLAVRCIRLMIDSLERDICEVEAPGTLVNEVDSDRVKQYLPPELRYACLYWVQHVQKGEMELCDEGQVHCFLKEHLLHWLEALSWIRRMSDGVNAIISLQSVIKNHDCPSLSTFVHDTRRFVVYNRSAIEQAPLQAYCSALVFSPMSSIVRKQFENSIPKWIQRPPKVQEDWPALLQTLEGHTTGVTAVAFSLDGTMLASASGDETIRLWNAATGAPLQTLEGHIRGVEAIAFSPDGTMLASASYDRTVRLWDTATGASQRRFRVISTRSPPWHSHRREQC